MAGRDRPHNLTDEEKEAIEAFYEVASAGEHYRLLGVAPDASEAHIRRAYYQLSRVWHPDRYFRRELGEYGEKLEKIFISITQAYNVLSDPERRAQYDEENAELIQASQAIARPSAPSNDSTVSDQADGLSYEITLDPESMDGLTTATQESKPPARKKRRRKHAPIPGLAKLKQQAAERIAKARKQYRVALAAAQESNWMRASAAIHLASRYDPRNQEYAKLAAEYREKARDQAAQQAIQAAENAEAYHNIKAAIFHYERACKVNPPSGLPFYRLAVLKQHEGEDEHEVLNLLRSAVEKQPDNTRYRLALAEYYAERKMNANARREYQAVLRIEPTNEDARSALKKVRQ